MVIMNPFASAGSHTGVARAPRFLTVSAARELGILLALSVLFPFMIHLLPIPATAELASRLLPMFYAPLLAALWGRTRSGLAVAAFAPWLNWAVTSHPSPLGAVVLTLQLFVFVGTVRALLFLIGARWFLAGSAYFAALGASALLVAVFPALGGGAPALAWAGRAAALGLPGIGIFVLLNWLALVYYPPPGASPAAT
jgi:hypothetical protein